MRTPPPALRWGRRLSLATRFGLLSGVLVALLGVTLGSLSAERIRRSNIDDAVHLIGFAQSMTLYTLTHLGTSGLPQTQVAEAQLGKLIVDATIHSDRLVGLAIWQGPQERLLYASGKLGPTAAQHAPGDLAAALKGSTRTSLITGEQSTPDPAVRALIRTNGPLLQVVMPVMSMKGAPPTAVQAFVPWRPVQKTITHQIIVMVWVLIAGLVLFWLVLFRLISRASRRLREQVDHNQRLANSDPLTGLPNRELLRRRVGAAIHRDQKAGRCVGLLLFDLDRFKDINDTLGHHFGDLLLREIGPRLSQVLRDGDLIARLGGDEFAVMLPGLSDAVHAQSLGHRLRAALSAPFVLDGVSLDVEASIGIAVTPDHGTDFETLLQHADVAMYVAKKANLGLSVYDPVLDEHSPMRLALIGELRSALAHPEQFVLHYQPKANMRTGELAGLEALVRWQHPERGLLGPDDFIPTAERTGMIRTLTDVVLGKALGQLREWRDAGLVTPIAVNLSTKCLLDPGLPDDVSALLDAYGLTGSELDVEITESAIMADPERAQEVLTRLVAIGVGIAIDDFGTGYSSMAHLKRLPVHEIKIDKSFVIDLQDSGSDAAIVRSIVELARNLGLGVVAEGVETPEAWQHLAGLGCTTAQGYYLARPLPPDSVLPWIARRRTGGPGIPPSRSVAGYTRY